MLLQQIDAGVSKLSQGFLSLVNSLGQRCQPRSQLRVPGVLRVDFVRSKERKLVEDIVEKESQRHKIL